MIFQSTLPARGATDGRKHMFRVICISIHAPRTGSDSPELMEVLKYGISIHAPRTGSDMNRVLVNAFAVRISIHAPRTGSDDNGLFNEDDIAISIHAPRTGSDLCVHGGRQHVLHFNPRSPHGERRGWTGSLRRSGGEISIHAPRTGSDGNHARNNAYKEISIHAPRTGSDRAK